MNIKIRKIIVSFLISFLLLPISVFAKDEIELKVDKTDLTINDEIIVSASVPNGLKSYAIIATLKYDTNVFQMIDESNFKVSETETVSYNPENNKFGIINRAGNILEDGNLFSIHLKVKEDANVGDTNIALTNISSSDGTSKITFPTTSTKVSVTRDAKEGEAIPFNKENVIKEDSEEVITTFNNMPVISNFIVLAFIVLIAVIYVYINMRKNKKNASRKPLFCLTILEIILLVIICFLFINNYNKRDVNKDGIKDYNDAEEIIKYLIDIEGVKEDNKNQSNSTNKNSSNNVSDDNINNTNNVDESNNDKIESNSDKNYDTNKDESESKSDSDYDTNNDGKVDIEDVGHVVESVTNDTKVKLTEQNDDNEYYINKGEIALRFKALVTPTVVKVTKVKIDDKYYDVIFNNDIYEVRVETPTSSGVHEFTITEVELDNGKKIETSLKITREVLKDTPYVNKFNLDDENKKLSFELVDEDSAFISGQVTIYDDDKSIANEEVQKDKTTIIFDATEDKTYSVEIVGNYDLDSKLNDDKNAFNNEIMLTQTFSLGGDYNFTLTNASITDALQVGEIPIVTFESTNARKAYVVNANLTIEEENKDYNITKREGNSYEIELDGADTSIGKHTVNLNNVGLTSLKTFYNNVDYKANTLTYTVLKAEPKVENLEIKNDGSSNNVNVSFNLNDENQSTSKLNVIMVDSLGKIVAQKELAKEDFSQSKKINLDLSYGNNVDGLYTVRILADYELADKYTFSDKSLGEGSILTHKDDIYISNMYVVNNNNVKIDNMFPTKGQKDYQILFEVSLGDSIKAYAKAKYKADYSQLSSVTINGLNYPASKIGNNTSTSKVYLIVPSEAGILDIKANRVQLTVDGYGNIYSTDTFSVEPKEITIDVLKDKPQITNLVINDDYDNNIVIVNFNVLLDKKEEAKNFSGKISLDGQTKDIIPGENEVIFTDIKKDTNMDLIFTGTYDLDSDPENGKNNKIDEELFKVTYGLYPKETYNKISIINSKVISKNNNEYFEKNEQIKLYFDFANVDSTLNSEPAKVVIDNKEYAITKIEEGYELILDGYNTSGNKKIEITKVILSNGKEVELESPFIFNLEVLKDKVKINDFKYEELKDSIKVTLSLKDYDHSLINKAMVKVTTESGKVILEEEYKNEIEFNKVEDVLRYNILITASYDRDIDTTNISEYYKENEILLDEIISIEKNNIELKNIKDVNLYKVELIDGNEKVSLINDITLSELNSDLDSYFVEIIMENMSAIRSKIKEVKNVDGRLILFLDYSYVTKDADNSEQIARIDFGKINDDGKVINETHPEDAFKALLEELNNNENVTLTHDYDAKGVEVPGDTYVSKDLTGTLNGNGFTIKNLTKPLYQNINGGTVENLRLEEIKMATEKGNGTIAITATNATFDRIFVDDYTKSISIEGMIGVIVGSATSSTIKNCSVINFIIDSGGWENRQQIGGLVGSTNNTNIINSYAVGSILGGWNFRAGLVGYAIGGNFENNYANVHIDYGMGRNNICGIACKGDNATFKNNLSLSTGVIDYPISQNRKESINNYYVESVGNYDSKLDDEHKITKEEINNELFIETLEFSPEEWSIRNVNSENLPILQAEKVSVVDTDNTDYDEEKETLYSNLIKLMPYYDSSKIIELAKNISDPLLINDVIAHIAPVDANGNLVTYLTNDNLKAISKIKLVYKSGEKEEFKVTYNKSYDMVATYKISDLNIDYNYNHYIIDSNSQVVSNLTNYLMGLDYTNNLDIITTNEDSRIYRDFYNETTKNELREFVLKYLSNSNYTNTNNDDGINSYIEREVKKDKNIEKALYVYNYFRRFYDLEIDGMMLYDFMMFNMQGFDKSLTPEKITSLYLGNYTGDNFNTNETNTKYTSILSGYTGKTNIPNFLEYMVTHFSNEKMAKWVAKEFKGILVEIPVKDHPEIQYTLWDHFSNPDSVYHDSYKVYEYILPILTLPETSAYIISAPCQFTIGAQRVYMGNPNDPVELAKFTTKMNAYVDRIESYYNTIYSIIKDPKIFNDIHLYQIDKRTTKNINGASVTNTPYSTNELFHKNFNEVVGMWPANQGVNAGNWGDRIEWNVAGFMDTDITTDGTLDSGHPTFMTWSHESAHYLDNRLFLKNNGRRFDAGGEDYADAMLMQEFSSVGIVMNLTVNYKKDLWVGTNLTPERINSADKIQDFYSKMFDTIYIMDYLEAQAFLQLSDEDKAEVGVQVQYPDEHAQFAYKTVKGPDGKDVREYYGNEYINDEYAKYRALLTTRYMPLYLMDEQIDYSSLQTIDDLIDNRIMLYPGNYKSSRGRDSYGGEGFDVVHWYQTNNPYGRPESYALKWISYEMLGYAGYNKGFIEYASNIHSEVKPIYSSLATPYNDEGNPNTTNVNFKSDAMALENITDHEYTDFNVYKSDRFKYVHEHLDHLNSIINAKEYVQKFYDALVEDGDNMKLAVKAAIKTKGTEADCIDDYWCIRALWSARGYTKSTEVRKELYYTLKNYTNDFSTDEIYMSDVQQDVSDLNVTK